MNRIACGRVTCLLLLALVPATAQAAAPITAASGAPAPARPSRLKDRFKLSLSGAFSPSSLAFNENRRFFEFAEEGMIEVDYAADPGPGFELGLQFRFARRFALAGSFSRLTRDQSGAFRAAFPHPLYLDRDRNAEGRLEGISYEEKAAHLDLVYVWRRGSFELAGFAGASAFLVKSRLLQRIQYAQSYPFDSITVTGAPTAAFKDNTLGFNVGGSLDYRLNQRFGLGSQVRFSRGDAAFKPPDAERVKLHPGGLYLAAGARVFF